MLNEDNHAMVQNNFDLRAYMVQMSNDNRALRQEVDELQRQVEVGGHHITFLERHINTQHRQWEELVAVKNQISSSFDRLRQACVDNRELVDMYHDKLVATNNRNKVLEKKPIKRKPVSGRRQLLVKVKQARKRRPQEGHGT